MNYDYWKKWAKCAAFRALKTFGQAAVASWGASQIGVADMDILGILSIALASALCSLFNSLAGLPELKAPVHPDQIETEPEVDPIESDDD